ncbi:hypothetical protein H5410_061565 [Solanum commersonii]|uniref:Uncharacterized protein n=1 Tax=Solanum commersonii TaxID=4109 RepID=A0A9J5W908_SOLCO|nr:hypothetical protein H5410_061565 [Solanum commersonii]
MMRLRLLGWREFRFNMTWFQNTISSVNCKGHEDNERIVDNAQQEVALIKVGMQFKKWHPTNNIIPDIKRIIER